MAKKKPTPPAAASSPAQAESSKKHSKAKINPAKQTKEPQAPPIPRQPFSRINFLYQASHLLATTTSGSGSTQREHGRQNPLSTFYSSHLRTIARKSVLRLDPSIKRTICKRCEALLIPGVSANHKLENRSKGGRKKQADVLVVECKGCGALKRFPVGMQEAYKLWTDTGEIVGGGKETEPILGP